MILRLSYPLENENEGLKAELQELENKWTAMCFKWKLKRKNFEHGNENAELKKSIAKLEEDLETSRYKVIQAEKNKDEVSKTWWTKSRSKWFIGSDEW